MDSIHQAIQEVIYNRGDVTEILNFHQPSKDQFPFICVNVPINFNTDSLILLIQSQLQVNLYDLTDDNYEENWEDVITAGNNLMVTNQRVTIYSNHPTLIRYLNMLNIPYDIEYRSCVLCVIFHS